MSLLKTIYNAAVWTFALLAMLPLGCLWALFGLCGEIAKALDRFGYVFEAWVKRRMLK